MRNLSYIKRDSLHFVYTYVQQRNSIRRIVFTSLRYLLKLTKNTHKQSFAFICENFMPLHTNVSFVLTFKSFALIRKVTHLFANGPLISRKQRANHCFTPKISSAGFFSTRLLRFFVLKCKDLWDAILFFFIELNLKLPGTL